MEIKKEEINLNQSEILGKEEARQNFSNIIPQEKEFKFIQSPSFFPRLQESKMNDIFFIWKNDFNSLDVESIKELIIDHMTYSIKGKAIENNKESQVLATILSIKEILKRSLNETQKFIKSQEPKIIYFLSSEYSQNKQLINTFQNYNLRNLFAESLKKLGFDLANIAQEEKLTSSGYTNNGIFSVSCLDSLTCLNEPVIGYGIKYDFGLFKQKLEDGKQIEIPNYLLEFENLWENERTDINYKIGFYGKTNKISDNNINVKWDPEETITATAYEIQILGCNSYLTNNLRLWKPSPNYIDTSKKANDSKNLANIQKVEELSTILYSDVSQSQTFSLKIKQEYFYICASLQDIIKQFKSNLNYKWELFPDKNAIHLNGSFSALALIELFRILLDEEKLEYDKVFNIVYNSFTYTQNIDFSKEQENWPLETFASILPRHIEIIFLINYAFIESIKASIPGNDEIIKNLSFIDEENPRSIKINNICFACCHKVITHSYSYLNVIKQKYQHFLDYYTIFKNGLYKDKFVHIPIGINQRRFLPCFNPLLTDLISSQLGSNEWLNDLKILHKLEKFINEKMFLENFSKVKLQNKLKLVDWINVQMKIKISPNSLFDVMINEFSECNRQLLLIFFIIDRYYWIKGLSEEQKNKVVPRVIFTGGRANPNDNFGKNIIKLMVSVSDIINNDLEIGDLLKLIFIPDYDSKISELLIPATDLTQFIPVAGTENIEINGIISAMNGALIIGTNDGINLEIKEALGENSIYIFGSNYQQVLSNRKQMKEGKRNFAPMAIRNAINAITCLKFGRFSEILEKLYTLMNFNDYNCICWDYDSYCQAQIKIDEDYINQNIWVTKSILTLSRIYYLSSDRSMNEYSQKIWSIKQIIQPK